MDPKLYNFVWNGNGWIPTSLYFELKETDWPDFIDPATLPTPKYRLYDNVNWEVSRGVVRAGTIDTVQLTVRARNNEHQETVWDIHTIQYNVRCYGHSRTIPEPLVLGFAPKGMAWAQRFLNPNKYFEGD